MSEIIQHYEHGEGYWYSQEVKLLLDADGEPIALGDTVFANRAEYRIVGIGTGDVWGEDEAGWRFRFAPEVVSHKTLDNWESIRQDLRELVETGVIGDWERGCADLIDRCKALAGEDE